MTTQNLAFDEAVWLNRRGGQGGRGASEEVMKGPRKANGQLLPEFAGEFNIAIFNLSCYCTS